MEQISKETAWHRTENQAVWRFWVFNELKMFRCLEQCLACTHTHKHSSVCIHTTHMFIYISAHVLFWKRICIFAKHTYKHNFKDKNFIFWLKNEATCSSNMAYISCLVLQRNIWVYTVWRNRYLHAPSDILSQIWKDLLAGQWQVPQ